MAPNDPCRVGGLAVTTPKFMVLLCNIIVAEILLSKCMPGELNLKS